MTTTVRRDDQLSSRLAPRQRRTMTIEVRTALVALLLVATTLACGSQSSSPSTLSTSRNEDVALAAAVRVEAEGCGTKASLGAGAFVADGLVVTVAHVVAGSDHVRVVLPDGSRPSATVVAIDRVKDLALLAVPSDIDPLPRGTMAPSARGSFVVYRDDLAVSRHFEAISFVDIDAPTIDRDGTALRRGYQLEAEVAKGDSGAVLVTNGVATAVVFARSTATDGKAWAVDLSEADPLLAAATSSAVDVGDCT